MSRTAGRNWANGYRTYRSGEVVGFVAALAGEVREISSRFLSQDQRFEIGDRYRTGVSIREIARRLGRAPSTISRERQRNAIPAKGYRPFEAHRRATAQRHRHRIEVNGDLRRVVGSCWRSGGVLRRSAGICGNCSRTNRGCGCVTKASTSAVSAGLLVDAPVAAGAAASLDLPPSYGDR